MFWKICLVGLLAGAVLAGEPKHARVPKKALQYMIDLGYYKRPDSELAGIANEKDVRNSLSSMQAFAGLPVSGILDQATQDLIKTPRCGLPDVSGSTKTRKKRYTLQGTRWHNKKVLTWMLMNDNDDGLSRKQVEEALTQAFNRWQRVTKMSFKKLTYTREAETNKDLEADIRVRFVHYYHNDPYPFDGPGGTLAHAFYPHDNRGLAGDLHFDDAEQYTLGTSQGKSLMWVAVHEIGHSLGLEHSNVRDAIMFPWYKGYLGEDFPLTDDDIRGVRAIYGEREASNTVAPLEKTLPPKLTKCPRGHDAVIYDKSSKRTYIFDGSQFFELDPRLKNIRGPFKISSYFSRLKSVDAGYINGKGRIVLFKNQMYYVYRDFLSRSQPMEVGRITKKYQGIGDVNRLDAVFIWPGNGRTYLFAGKDYYRFEETSGRVDYRYPRDIVPNWGGVPSHVDSAFTWRNGVSYIFKAGKFYRMSAKARVEKGYPKLIEGAWYKCAGNLKVQRSMALKGNSGGRDFAAFNAVIISSFLSLYYMLG